MNAQRWARITALLHDACERPPADRERWLQANCDDETIRDEVAAMLRSYEADPEFLEQPANAATAVGTVLSGGWVGRRLGAYRLVAEIGRGGMGVVYEARRDDEDFDRRVAIKILPSWSGSDLDQRFRQERRVLAAFDHPGIARLVDSGSTDDGAPYFVMEYVDGKPIDQWCREQKLDVASRVGLIERVSDALGVAHQNLVIHRDVKPANILVTAGGQPKLLDFGIATLLTDGQAAAGLTRTGYHSFTAEYASPEQVRGERVTTASDVYSLGVVLYLLLTGRLPYDLAGRSPLETLRIVCEVDPPLMSTVTTGSTRTKVRGDLDAIVAKALRKAPGDRYVSMAAFAADLQAWRTGRPVGAARQSFWYRTRSLVHRNWKVTTAAAAVVIALSGGAVATAWQARIADAERDKAQNRFRQVREFSRSLLFDVHNALRAVPGATESRRLLLDRAVQFLDGLAADAGNDDELLLELTAGYQQLAQVQGNGLSENVGNTAAAMASLEKAAQIVDGLRTRRPGDTEVLRRSISVYFDLATVQGERGDPRARSSQQQHEALLGQLENRHDTTPRVVGVIAEGYSNAGFFHVAREEFGAAEAAYRKSVALFESVQGADRTAGHMRSHAFALKRLGAVLLRAQKYDDSERYYRQALALDDQVVRLDDRPQTRYDITFTLSDLGLVQSRRGQWDDAVALWQRALEIRRAAVDADPKNLRALAGMATLLGRLANAAAARNEPQIAAATYRDELRVRDQVVAIAGALPVRVSEQAWARLNLAAALLDSSVIAPHDPSRASWLTESAHLVRAAGRDSGKISVTAGSEPDYRLLHDTLTKRLDLR